jgi:hypothetical protein
MRRGRGAKPKTVLSWMKRGDGKGEGSNYKPALRIRDASRGWCTRVKGLKTKRIHHFLSHDEYLVFILAEQSPLVVDIREQYPLLPWGSTVRIAEEMGIRHSLYPQSVTPIVMTSDIVLTYHRSCPRSQAVLCVKQSADIDVDTRRSQRTLEKLLVEAEYWKRLGVPWRIVTEKDIPLNRVRNLEWVRPSMAAKELDWLSDHMFVFLDAFHGLWTSDRTLKDILDRISSRLGMDRRHCFALFARTVWMNRLEVDLDAEIIDMLKPLRRAPIDVSPGGKGIILQYDQHQ